MQQPHVQQYVGFFCCFFSQVPLWLVLSKTVSLEKKTDPRLSMVIRDPGSDMCSVELRFKLGCFSEAGTRRTKCMHNHFFAIFLHPLNTHPSGGRLVSCRLVILIATRDQTLV